MTVSARCLWWHLHDNMPTNHKLNLILRTKIAGIHILKMGSTVSGFLLCSAISVGTRTHQLFQRSIFTQKWTGNVKSNSCMRSIQPRRRDHSTSIETLMRRLISVLLHEFNTIASRQRSPKTRRPVNSYLANSGIWGSWQQMNLNWHSRIFN